MAGIIRFDREGPGKGLARWEDIPRDSLVAGKPVQREHFYFQDKALGLSTGVWSCTAMTMKPAPYPCNEFMILLEGTVTVIDGKGRETLTRAGQSFVIPKGMVCAWKQKGYVRKFFVIFEDEGAPTPDRAEAEALRVLQPDPKATLARARDRRRSCCSRRRRSSASGNISPTRRGNGPWACGTRPPITARPPAFRATSSCI
jgi:uncharacterized cupin superfamily protein